MIKKIKLHLHKYIFTDILAIFIFIILNVITIKLINDIKENKKYNNDFSIYNKSIIEAYKVDPSIFNFNEKGIAIIKVDDLNKPITNGQTTISVFASLPLTKEQDECRGYIIVKKLNNDFDIDTSHLCDMIDY